MRSMSFPRLREAAVPLAAVLLGGCLYSFSGGGGLPANIETIYVPPVENRTNRFALTDPITQGLLEAVRGRLGARVAAEQAADAVIRVRITGYDDRAMNFEAQEGVGAEVFQRRVSVAASVEFIDLVRGDTIWSSTSVQGTGEYAPDQETEEAGIELAVENLIQKIVDGTQSQW